MRTAADGEFALGAIDIFAPDVMLLDAQMPGIDGLDVCRRIKANPAARLTPVIMVAGLPVPEHNI